MQIGAALFSVGCSHCSVVLGDFVGGPAWSGTAELYRRFEVSYSLIKKLSVISGNSVVIIGQEQVERSPAQSFLDWAGGKSELHRAMCPVTQGAR
jgi:hypothetical protein